MTTGELESFVVMAEKIALEARALILSRLGQRFTHQLKADGSFVTSIDTAVEDLIRSRLGTMVPGHGVLGEERGAESDDSEFVWVIDPIDGTHSLRHGVPLYGTLLALRHDDRSVLGVIDLPQLSKTYVAARGLGAKCNGRSLHLQDVTDESAIQHEIIAIGERKQFLKAGQIAVFDRLMRAHGSVRTYCDCFGHTLAIAGSVGAMIDYDLRIWDVAATEVIMREVGGTYLRMNNNRGSDARADRHDVVFGKPAVVKWILGIIGG
jgi:fructose-1,6-bisphosphatase/inositol monophosphatase family enzyme